MELERSPYNPHSDDSMRVESSERTLHHSTWAVTWTIHLTWDEKQKLITQNRKYRRYELKSYESAIKLLHCWANPVSWELACPEEWKNRNVKFISQWKSKISIEKAGRNTATSCLIIHRKITNTFCRENGKFTVPQIS